MSETTDVLIGIDTSALPTLSKDKLNPTTGLNNYVYLVITKDKIITGNADSEIEVEANIDDRIRWRVMSLNGCFDCSVMLYQFNETKENSLLSAPFLMGGVQSSTAQTIKKILPIQGDMPLSGEICDVPYACFQSSIKSTGCAVYQWCFQVNKTSDGSLVGYGMWDPFITISNR